jgi:hypothetical protein
LPDVRFQRHGASVPDAARPKPAGVSAGAWRG